MLYQRDAAPRLALNPSGHSLRVVIFRTHRSSYLQRFYQNFAARRDLLQDPRYRK